MTSKAYLPRKCVSRKEESHNGSKVQKRTPFFSTSNKSRTFQSLKSSTNVKKCSTTNANSKMNKRQNLCDPQPLSDNIEETEFAGFTNLVSKAKDSVLYSRRSTSSDRNKFHFHHTKNSRILGRRGLSTGQLHWVGRHFRRNNKWSSGEKSPKFDIRRRFWFTRRIAGWITGCYNWRVTNGSQWV